MTVCALAQEKFIPTIVREDNETIRAITKEVDPAGWLYFKDDIRLQATEFFTQHKAATGLKEADEMKLQKTWSDEFGEYRRYQQFHKGIKVYGAEFDEQIKGGRVEMVHGKLVEDLDTDVNHHISEAEALDAALAKIGAKSYAWQNENIENGIKTQLGTNATTYPKGELMFYIIKGEQLVKENYALVWRFEIGALEPSSDDEVIVDAIGGNVLSIRPLAVSDGPAVTTFNGTRTIDTSPSGGTNILRTNGNGRNIHTRENNAITAGTTGMLGRFNEVGEISNATDNWLVAQRVPTSAHFAASTAWDYFSNTFGRNGMNGAGGLVRVITSTGVQNNAFFSRDAAGNDFIRLGVTTATAPAPFLPNLPIVGIDVVGHEFTHGIARATANFGTINQPAALNESFSDIFGTMVERSLGNFNWVVGENTGALRSLQTPASIATDCGTPPTIFQGAGWVQPGGCDFGGIHHNCSIQNLWFFLLAQGGTQNGVTVQGIGIDNAARIAFRNLTTKSQSQSGFLDARNGAVSSAEDLFGRCEEYRQTINAWTAVGIGGTFSNTVYANFPNQVCPSYIPFDLNATSLCPTDIFSWQLPSNWTFTYLNTNKSIVRVTSIGTVTTNTNVPVSVTSTLYGGSQAINLPVYKKCGSGTTLTNNHTNGDITLYPNPSYDNISMQVSNTFINGEWSIYDVAGKVIKKGNINQNNSELDLSELSSGLFFCKVQKNEIMETIKFVKL
jgi:bacillolysin